MAKQEYTMAGVVKFFRNYWSKSGAKNPEAAGAAWAEVQSQMEQYLAQILAAAAPAKDKGNDEEYQELVDLCGDLLTNYEQAPIDPDKLVDLKHAIDALANVNAEFAKGYEQMEKAGLAGSKAPAMDNAQEESEKSASSFWEQMLALVKRWKAKEDKEGDTDDEDYGEEDPNREFKFLLLENALGPAGPWLRISRQLFDQYREFFKGMAARWNRRWLFFKDKARLLWKKVRGVFGFAKRFLKWLLRYKQTVGGGGWFSKLKGITKIFKAGRLRRLTKVKLGRLMQGSLGKKMSMLRAVDSKIMSAGKNKFVKAGVVGLAGAVFMSKANAALSAVQASNDQLARGARRKSDDEDHEYRQERKDEDPKGDVQPNVDQVRANRGFMPGQTPVTPQPSFDPTPAQQAKNAEQSTAAPKPQAKPKRPGQEKPKLDKKELAEEYKDAAKGSLEEKGKSKQIAETLSEQGELAGEAQKQQAEAAKGQLKETDSVMFSDKELRGKEKDVPEKGFFEKLLGMITGGSSGGSSGGGSGGGGADVPAMMDMSDAKQVPAEAPKTSSSKSYTSSEGSGDGAPPSQMKTALKSKPSKASTKEDTGQAGGYIERGRKSITFGGNVKLDGMNPGFMRNFYAMVGEYNAKTGKKVQINSAVRTREQQAALRAKYGKMAAPPGTSMHEFGYAIDIQSDSGNALDRMGLLQKYGFVRPVKGEAWHVEQAGTQANKHSIRAGKEFKRQDRSGESGGGGGGAEQAAPPETEGATSPQQEQKAQVDKNKKDNAERKKKQAEHRAEETKKKRAVRDSQKSAAEQATDTARGQPSVADQVADTMNQMDMPPTVAEQVAETAQGLPPEKTIADQVAETAKQLPPAQEEQSVASQVVDTMKTLPSTGGEPLSGGFEPLPNFADAFDPDKWGQQQSRPTANVDHLIGQPIGQESQSKPAGRAELLAALGPTMNQLQSVIPTDFSPSNVKNLFGANIPSVAGIDPMSLMQGLQNPDQLVSQLKDKATGALTGGLQEKLSPFLTRAQEHMQQVQPFLDLLNGGAPSSALGSILGKLGISDSLGSISSPFQQMQQQIDETVAPLSRIASQAQQYMPDMPVPSYQALPSVSPIVDQTVDMPAEQPADMPKPSAGSGLITIDNVPLVVGDMSFVHLNLGIGGR